MPPRSADKTKELSPRPHKQWRVYFKSGAEETKLARRIETGSERELVGIDWHHPGHPWVRWVINADVWFSVEEVQE